MLSLREKLFFTLKHHGEGPKLMAEIDDLKEGVDIPTTPIPFYMRPKKLFGQNLKILATSLKREIISSMP